MTSNSHRNRVQDILVLASAVLALSSCKDQISLIAPEETPPPTIAVSNLPEAFEFTLTGKNLTDTLSYVLSFSSDSLLWSLAVSAVTSGSLQIQILDTLDVAVFQDSSSNNIAQTKSFKIKSHPRTVRLIFSHFTGATAFALHAAQVLSEAQTILGAWEWTSSDAEAFTRTLTPQTEGYTSQVYFMSDSSFAMFRNDTLLVCRGKYSVTFDEDLSVTQTAFPFYGFKMVFFITDQGSLEIHPYPWAFDTGVSRFVRRTG